MNEEAVSFGSDGRLVGIISAPENASCAAEKPAVLLVNAGLLHRVGPYRLYVELARRLTAMGHYVLRFDLSGIGDSRHGDDTRLYEERVLDNIASGMDLLSKRHGTSRFVLMGLCAGADNAHKAAIRDPRVTGVVFLDGYGYRTFGYYLHRYVPKLLSLKRYQRFVSKKLFSKPFSESSKPNANRLRSWEIFVRQFPPKAQVEREIQVLVKRDVRLMYIYTGGLAYSYYNHRRQFHAMFRSVDFRGNAQSVYLEQTQHTFPTMADRDSLISTICRWMRENSK